MLAPYVFSWPLQLEMRVSMAPSAFPSGKKSYLFYELYLSNFSEAPVTLLRLEVLNGSSKLDHPLASFGTEELESMVQPIGRTPSSRADSMRLAGGESVMVFMAVETDQKTGFPDKILHRIVTDSAELEGAAVETHRTRPLVLGAPLVGDNWLAADGPGNSVDNHHRRGTLLFDGTTVNSRRFAVDWKQTKDGSSFAGDKRDVHSYFCYGTPVLSVADGRVLNAKDGLPDNIPGHGSDFHPGVPISLDTIAGNTITLDLGGGQYAYYMHLRPGSLRVRGGDMVKKGQLLAAVGASGDAREPHLHFEVTTSSKLLLGEGLPYVLEHYRSKAGSAVSTFLHERELPLDDSIVSFDDSRHGEH